MIQYCSTWASSTRIILFSEMLTFSMYIYLFTKENKESDGMKMEP